jgi:hypothetical protein
MNKVTVAITIWLCSIQQAQAYLDPGAGSILLQSVIAMLSTLIVSISLGWSHIKKAIILLYARIFKGPTHHRQRNEKKNSE